MKFLISLSEKPDTYQLLWVHIIAETEKGNHVFEPLVLCKRYKMSKSTLKRCISWGISELNAPRVKYRAFWKHTMLHVSVGSDGIIQPSEPKSQSISKKVSQLPFIEEIIAYLNEKTGRNFKSNSKIAIRHINSRLTEGYKIEDFKKVVDIKTSNWMGTKMESFCRPETLFGNKFDSYLNENSVENEQQSRFITTQRAVDEAKDFDFFSNQSQ